jgi:GNAT superfamily N-acetyltransferase
MIICPAHTADVEQLVMLKQPRTEEHKVAAEKMQSRRLAEAAEGKAAYLVAREGSQIVGHVFVKFYGTPMEPYPNLEDLYVRGDRRSRGIGTELLSRSECLVREKGYTRVGLSVNPTLNPRAKALYERLGYRDVGGEPYLGGVYDGDEDWVIDMVKLLD